MKNIWIIIKKEMVRVLKDPKLIVMLLLPGLIIYLMYSIMGNAISDMTTDENTTFSVYSINMPDEVQDMLEGLNAEVSNVTASQTQISGLVEGKKEALSEESIHLIVVFDEGYSVLGITTAPPVKAYYNSTSTISSHAFQMLNIAMQTYKDTLILGEGFNPLAFSPQIEDVGNAALSAFAMFVPFILITFLFNGCMAVAPDAIAGEKERGTIATILITPVERHELALGKVFSLSILAVISAFSSFVGLMLSLPAMMGMSSSDVGKIIGFGQYATIFLVIVSTVLLIIGVMAIISAFAKTVKEANMLLVPFMLVSMVVGLSTMFGDGGAATNLALYFIPLYNTVQALISVITSKAILINLVVTFVSNIVYTAIAIFVLAKLFNNEKIMFKK